MAPLDDDIDRLYQGPLDAFTDARNALAKAAKTPELKKLEKPSLPAWTINQLHWHQRPVLDRLEAAAAALLEQHHRLLAGTSAGVPKAEQAHREAVKEALAAARDVLRRSGHPETPATLDAVRNTLQALPAAEAQGRLTRPLQPRGLEALAGLVLPARSAGASMTPAAAGSETLAADDAGAAARQREAERFGARARDERARAQQREAAQRQADAERAARERAREEQRAAAVAALAAAEDALKAAETAVSDAEQALADRQAERYAAQQAVKRARQAAAD